MGAACGISGQRAYFLKGGAVTIQEVAQIAPTIPRWVQWLQARSLLLEPMSVGEVPCPLRCEHQPGLICPLCRDTGFVIKTLLKWFEHELFKRENTTGTRTLPGHRQDEPPTRYGHEERFGVLATRKPARVEV